MDVFPCRIVSVFVGASVTIPSIFSVCLLTIGVYATCVIAVVSLLGWKYFGWNSEKWETNDWRNPIYVLERRHEIENADDLKSIRRVIIIKKQVDFWVNNWESWLKKFVNMIQKYNHLKLM